MSTLTVEEWVGWQVLDEVRHGEVVEDVQRAHARRVAADQAAKVAALDAWAREVNAGNG